MTAGDPAKQAQTPPPQGQSNPVRLGDLLTSAGLLKAEELRQAMLIAKSQGLPVGRVIIMSGFMSEVHLQAAVQCQSLLKDNVINIDSAVAALRTIARENCTLDEALTKLGVKQAGQVTNKLGELLIEAGLVTNEQLEASLLHGKTSGLPLGRVLVVTGVITEQMLASVLNAQILIRDRRVDRDQAISSLRAAKERQVPIEQTLEETGINVPSNETIRLGELLVMAKLINEEQLMQSVEMGLVREQPIGQVLVENGHVSDSILQQALSVQNYVSSGKLRRNLSGQVLDLIQKEGISIEAALEKVQPEKQQISNNLPLYQFLQLAGVIGPKDIEEALKAGSRNAQLMGQMLMLTGAVDQNLLSIALKCSELMAQGILKAEQAVIALGICWKTKASLEEAFKQLGWSPAIIAAAFPSQHSPGQKPVGPTGAAAQFTPTSHQQSGTHQSPLAQALQKGRGADATAAALPALTQVDANKRRSDATAAALPAMARPGQPTLNQLDAGHDTGENPVVHPVSHGSNPASPQDQAVTGGSQSITAGSTVVTGDHTESSAATGDYGRTTGEHATTAGEHSAITQSTGAAGALRKKKLSDLIPQIKNMG